MDNSWAVARVYALAATMVAVYLAIFQSLLKNCASAEKEKASLFLAARTQGLQQQLDAQHESAIRLRQFGAEVDRFLQDIAPFLSGELAEKASSLSGRIENPRKGEPALHGCRNPIVKQALSLTIRRSHQMGIRVAYGFDIPEKFHQIEPSELAAVLVAALENAVAACSQNTGGPELYICYVNGQLAVETACPSESLSLDDNGFPALPDAIGRERVQAIAAFTAKYGERPYYQIRNETLYLRLLIDDEGGLH